MLYAFFFLLPPFIAVTGNKGSWKVAPWCSRRLGKPRNTAANKTSKNQQVRVQNYLGYNSLQFLVPPSLQYTTDIANWYDILCSGELPRHAGKNSGLPGSSSLRWYLATYTLLQKALEHMFPQIVHIFVLKACLLNVLSIRIMSANAFHSSFISTEW